MYFGKKFEKSVMDADETIIKEHHDVDVIGEETFRNCKTVAALGAQSKFYSAYERIVGVNHEGDW